MKCILLTTLIYCVFFTTNISAQYKNVFIPEWNEEQGTSFEKYNKNTVKNKYYMALEKLEIKDQLYRKHEVVDWEKQDLLDSLNRIALDSLFELNGFPSREALGGNKSNASWFVLQHSTDCEWNKKWIERFLDAKLDGHKISSPLFATIVRFFDPESGYCKDSESFIKHLKSKYPKEFAKDYKYEKFYE